MTLAKEELLALLTQATPIRIHMSDPDGPERWVELDRPRELELVPDVGAQLEASGRFRFEAIGIPLEDEIRDIRVTIRPEIDDDETGMPVILFHLDLDQADLATLPGFLDRGVTKIVDSALRADKTHLIVPFGRLFSKESPITPRVQPLAHTRVGVERGSLTILEDKLIFAVDLDVELLREGGMGEHPAT